MPSEDSFAHRLHPVSPLFRIGSAARALLLPGLAVLFLSRGGNYETWLMLLFLPTAAGTLAQYWSYRYRFKDDELVVREGIISRNERHIPYARIQNIDLVQNPLHRMFNVAEVRIETAGGQKPEATMRVLSLAAVEGMRERVFAGRREPARATEADTADEPDPRRDVHRLTLGDVMLFGVISNRGMVLVAAAFGVLWQTDSFERVIEGAGRDEVDSVVRTLADRGPVAIVLASVLALATFLVAVRLLSLVWALIKFHGFRLTRERETFRAEYGMFTRVAKSMSRRRIQVLSTDEGPLHRLSGRVSVQVQTAGGGDDAASTGKLWLAPLIERAGLDRLLAEALPGVAVHEADWQSISPRAARRLLRVLAIGALPVGAAAVWLGTRLGTPWPVVVVAAVVVFLAFHIRMYCRHAGWALLPDAVVWRSGWWKRRVNVVRFSKIQAIEMTASPFDRRHRMATVRVDTAGAGALGQGVEMAYLDADVAGSVTEKLAHAASRAEFLW